MIAVATKIRFTKTEAGRYHAKGAAHTYLVLRADGGWELIVSTKKTVAGVEISDREIHTSWCDTKALAVLVAEEFEALGENYRAHEHGYRERITEAVIRAYEKEKNDGQA